LGFGISKCDKVEYTGRRYTYGKNIESDIRLF
jgi:hypothetical protein